MRLVLHSKVSSSAITIDIHLLDPGVDVRFNDFRTVKIPVKRVFDPGHGYLRRQFARFR